MKCTLKRRRRKMRLVRRRSKMTTRTSSTYQCRELAHRPKNAHRPGTHAEQALLLVEAAKRPAEQASQLDKAENRPTAQGVQIRLAPTSTVDLRETSVGTRDLHARTSQGGIARIEPRR